MSAMLQLTHWVDSTIRNAFRALGGSIVNRPWLYIVGPIGISIPLMMGYFFTILAYPPVIDGVNSVEYNGDQLYTPSSAQAFQDRETTEAIFGEPPNPVFFYIGPQGPEPGGLITQKRVLSMYDVWERSSMESFEFIESDYIYGTSDEPQSITLQDICQKNGVGVCLQSTILSFWDYNRTLISSLSDAGLMQMVVDKNYTATELDGSETLWGQITNTAENGTILAAQFKYFIQSNSTAIMFAPDGTPESLAYEKAISDQFNGNQTLEDDLGLDVHFWSLSVQETEADKATTFDSGLIPIGFIFLVVYSVIVLTTNNRVHSHGMLATFSFACTGLAIATAYGIGCWMGLQFSLVVQVTAFLIVGLGMDDTFVIVAAFNEPDVRKLPTKERVQEAMARAGASISVTTITDMFAFVIGSITEVPAIQSFCYYAAIGVSVTFLFQITTFCAILTYSSYREEANRKDWTFTKSTNPEKNMCSNDDYDPLAHDTVTKCFIGYSKILMKPWVKVSVLLLTAVFIGFGSWGAYELEIAFDYESFIPPSSFFNEVIDFRNANFGQDTSAVTVYTLSVPYYTVEAQTNLTELDRNLAESKELQDNSCNMWWRAFKDFAASQPNTTLTSYGVDPSQFNETIVKFFNSNVGQQYMSNFVFNGDDYTQILGTKTFCTTTAIGGDSMLGRIDQMKALRLLVENATELGPPIVYTPAFVFFEGLEQVRTVVFSNIALAVLAVLIVGIVILGNLTTILLVFIMLLAIDAQVMGLMYLWDGSFNYVTGINLVLAVGLSVDPCAHISHAFLTATGTGNERSQEALKLLGKSVFNGLVSTTMIMVPFFFLAESYIFITFYRSILVIMICSGWQGLVVLPVLLSLIKPISYAEVEKKLRSRNGVAADSSTTTGVVENVNEKVSSETINAITSL